MPIRISYPQDTIRMPLSAFIWQPEIAEPSHRVVGKLIGDRRSLQVMPDTIEVVSEQTGHVVTFKQRYADIHRYYSTESDYLIEIFF
jgi:hypothetical protein